MTGPERRDEDANAASPTTHPWISAPMKGRKPDWMMTPPKRDTGSVMARARRKSRIGTCLSVRDGRAQSGHLIPTGAGTEQRVQMGVPQDEHVSSVSSTGWRAQFTATQ